MEKGKTITKLLKKTSREIQTFISVIFLDMCIKIKKII